MQGPQVTSERAKFEPRSNEYEARILRIYNAIENIRDAVAQYPRYDDETLMTVSIGREQRARIQNDRRMGEHHARARLPTISECSNEDNASSCNASIPESSCEKAGHNGSSCDAKITCVGSDNTSSYCNSEVGPNMSEDGYDGSDEQPAREYADPSKALDVLRATSCLDATLLGQKFNARAVGLLGLTTTDWMATDGAESIVSRCSTGGIATGMSA